MAKEDFTKAQFNKTNLELDRDFEIIGYEKNINKGTAKVTVRGMKEYCGTKTILFNIQANNANNFITGVLDYIVAVANLFN